MDWYSEGDLTFGVDWVSDLDFFLKIIVGVHKNLI